MTACFSNGHQRHLNFYHSNRQQQNAALNVCSVWHTCTGKNHHNSSIQHHHHMDTSETQCKSHHSFDEAFWLFGCRQHRFMTIVDGYHRAFLSGIIPVVDEVCLQCCCTFIIVRGDGWGGKGHRRMIYTFLFVNAKSLCVGFTCDWHCEGIISVTTQILV